MDGCEPLPMECHCRHRTLMLWGGERVSGWLETRRAANLSASHLRRSGRERHTQTRIREPFQHTSRIRDHSSMLD
jgi:hypothetical protein